MPRLTISLPQTMHNQLSLLSAQQNDSLSRVINKLLQVGMYHLNEEQLNQSPVIEKHCQQLIIQMHTLIKYMSSDSLNLNLSDFERLRQASLDKLNQLSNQLT